MNEPRLEVSARVWTDLISGIRTRGAGTRESGAFLLGDVVDGARQVRQIVPYEELEQAAALSNHVRLTNRAFQKLWDTCACDRVQVVADIHSHPFGATQSRSDRENPMIALKGHLALIVPYFAMRGTSPSDVTINEYIGAHRWRTFDKRANERILIIV